MSPVLVNPFRFGPPAPPPFSPADLSGLMLWLKADVGAYTDAGVTLATNGQTVRQWNDQSGGNRHVSNANSLERPTFRTGIVNGLPAVDFANGNYLGGTLASSASFTCAFITRRANLANNLGILGFHSSSSVRDAIYPSRGSDGSRQFGVWDNTNSWKQSSGTGSTASYQPWALVRDNTAKTIRFWLNSVFNVQRTYASTPASGPTGNWVGRTDPSEYMQEKIVELIFYNVAHSDTNVDLLNTYMRGRLGI